MKIEVKNFGPIKKGQIDLDKKVTVFVGNNNSGKSYMSQLMWSLNSSENILSFNGTDSIPNPIGNKSIIVTKEIAVKIIEAYSVFLRNNVLPDLFNVKKDFFSIGNFSIFFLNFIDEFLIKLKNTSFSFYYPYQKEGEMQGYYTGYYSFKKAMNSFQILIETNVYTIPKNLHEISDKELSEIPSYTAINDTKDMDFFKQEIAKTIIEIIFNGNLFDEKYKTFFLPANRVFYPSYYKQIYSVAKEEKDLIDSRLKKGFTLDSLKALLKTPYSKAVDDLIREIYELNKTQNESGFYPDLLIELKEIIGGDIIVKSVEGIAPVEFFLKLDDGKELDMYMSSSSANQLATLNLYLKFWAEEKENFLIIDEPEENLHPENQIKLINLLMKFADRGNKILITTHSPLITDHINNYANLSYLNEAGENTEHLIAEGNTEMAAIKKIKHADYGVYFFNGDSIKEYEIGDYGAYFRDFALAEEKVKDMSNTLRDNIYKNINEKARKSLQQK